jgi:hypothetical protein
VDRCAYRQLGALILFFSVFFFVFCFRFFFFFFFFFSIALEPDKKSGPTICYPRPDPGNYENSMAPVTRRDLRRSAPLSLAQNESVCRKSSFWVFSSYHNQYVGHALQCIRPKAFRRTVVVARYASSRCLVAPLSSPSGPFGSSSSQHRRTPELVL